MAKNYYSIHPNKSKRKSIQLGMFLSPERKRNLALKMSQAMSYEFHKNIEYMEIYTKGFRKDNLIGVIGDEVTFLDNNTISEINPARDNGKPYISDGF